MGKRGQLGVSATFGGPRSRKEKRDAQLRKEDNWRKKKKMMAAQEKLYGAFYECASCGNTTRIADVGDRKIMCSKCYSGFYVEKPKK